VTDVDLLEKKLAFIETCMHELRQLSQPERIAHDIREERFVAHTLQIAQGYPSGVCDALLACTIACTMGA
jgi:hypothetical protein